MSFPLPGQRWAGRFDIRRELGRGGFATVFEAFDPTAGVPVALKVLHRDAHQDYELDLRQRFEREVAIVARLSSPATVQLLSHGEDEGYLWAAFELVPGRDLREVLDEAGTLPAGAVRAVVLQILESLAEAHRNGLIHRDLKPENIRVFDGAHGPLTVKVLDFGIARSTDGGHPSLTKTGELVGTPRYMSPEQLKAQPLTPASDIYSLGLVACELLCGKDSLPGGALGQQLARVAQGLEVSFAPQDEGERALVHAIERMVDVDPAQRLRTAVAVQAALGAGAERAVASGNRSFGAAWLGLALVAIGGIAALAWPSSTTSVRTTGLETRERGNPLRPTVTPDPVEPDASAEAKLPPNDHVCVQSTKRGRFDTESSGGVYFVPDNVDASTPIVVVAANLRVSSAPDTFDRAGIAKAAQEHNIVVFVANGAPQQGEDERWNAKARDRFRIDLKKISDAWCLERSSRFLVGMQVDGGNGAQMLESAYPDLFDAIALSERPLKVEKDQFSEAVSALVPGKPLPPNMSEFSGTLPLIDLALETEEPDKRRLSRRKQVYESLNERRQRLLTKHRCDGKPKVSADTDVTRCEAFDCEVPLELCTIATSDEWFFLPPRMWEFFNEHRASVSNEGVCAPSSDRGLLEVEGSGGIYFVPKSLNPKTPILVGLENFRAGAVHDWFEARGYARVAEQHDMVVFLPNDQTEGDQTRSWSLAALQRIRRELDQIAQRLCVQDSPRFLLGSRIEGGRGAQLFVEEFDGLFRAAVLSGKQLKVYRNPLRAMAAKAERSAGRPDGSASLNAALPILDLSNHLSVTAEISLGKDVFLESHQNRRERLLREHQCDVDSGVARQAGEFTCERFECDVPLELCLAQEKEFPDVLPQRAWEFLKEHRQTSKP